MDGKILLIDDEADLLKVYRTILERSGYSVVTAESARDGLRAAIDSRPDLVVCDVSMPGGDGVSLCRKLRTDPRTQGMPVILYSGVHKEAMEQIQALELGADDYLSKPVPPGVLTAKVRAILRRCARLTAPVKAALKAHGLELDLDARKAALKGRALPLTRKEFDLLHAFLRQPGRVLSIPYLLETVWGYDPADYNDPHTVGVHVSSLRRKLGEVLSRRIVSVPALGYRFEAAS